MYTAAELLTAVEARYRRRFPLHAERAFGEFPPTWRQWFLAIEARVDAITGSRAVDWIDVFSQRPLRLPEKALPPLGRVRAWLALLRVRWEPAPREERGLRAVAATLSAICHVVLLFLFFWAVLVRIDARPPASDDAGDVTLVEFIGDGTPETPGDAAPDAAVEEASRGEPGASGAQAAADSNPQTEAEGGSTAAAPAEIESSTTERTVPEDVSQEPADTASDPAVAEEVVPAPPVTVQPLVVTETRTPDTSFTLPSTTLPLPQPPVQTLPATESAASSREIPLVDRTAPTPALPVPQQRRAASLAAPATVPTREIPLAPRPTQAPALPVPQPRTVTLPDAAAASTGREIVLAPQPQAETRALPLPGAPPRRLTDANAGRTGPAREIPLRASPTAAAGNGSAGQSSPSSAASGRPETDGAAARGAARTPTPASVGRPGGTARAGAGPQPAKPPGGLPSTVRGDDWGASDRSRSGSGAGREGGTGLFNSDGSVRLPGDGGRVGGGLPPGTITEDFAKIDRMGTWLRRPSVDYTPSRFDKIFVPSESLLQEWVRKNVREVFVPIPGTTKRIRCVVSLLQAAGGCTVDDPNLQDQEAEARPPPTVPYKPELQERD